LATLEIRFFRWRLGVSAARNQTSSRDPVDQSRCTEFRCLLLGSPSPVLRSRHHLHWGKAQFTRSSKCPLFPDLSVFVCWLLLARRHATLFVRIRAIQSIAASTENPKIVGVSRRPSDPSSLNLRLRQPSPTLPSPVSRHLMQHAHDSSIQTAWRRRLLSPKGTGGIRCNDSGP